MKIFGMRLMILVLALGLGGCLTVSAMSDQLTSLAVAECKTEDVQVSDEFFELNGTQNWTAECNGKTYQCSYLEESDLNCYQVEE